MTAYQYLVVGKPGHYRVVFMEQQDTRTALAEMARARDITRDDYYLMSSSGKVIAQDAANDFARDAFEATPRLSFLTKVFTHQWNFTKLEKQFLRELPDDQRDLLFDFLETQIVGCWGAFGPVLAGLKDQLDR